MKKICSILLKFAKYLMLLMVILVSLSVLSYFFLADALNLDSRINEEMRARLGIDCSIGTAHVILLPKPGLLLDDVNITPPASWFGKSPAALMNLNNFGIVNSNSTSLNQQTNSSVADEAGVNLTTGLANSTNPYVLPQPLPQSLFGGASGQNATSPLLPAAPVTLASPATPATSVTPVPLTEMANNSLYVKNLSVYFDIFSLFQGKVLASSIGVDGLVLKVQNFEQATLIIDNIARTSTARDDSDAQIQAQAEAQAPAQAEAQAPAQAPAETQAQANDPWTVAEIANILASVHVSNSSVQVWDGQKAFVPLLEDIEIGNFLGKFGASFFLHTNVKDVPYGIRFDFDVSKFTAKGAETEFKLKLELDDERGFNPNFSTQFKYDENSGIAKLENLQLKSEKSSLNGDVQITFNDSNNGSGWLLSGPVEVRKMDLTRWISTLRDLSPELQMLLSDIDANLDLVANSEGVFFKNIDAHTGNYHCSGFGSVLDFKNPAISYDFSVHNAFPIEIIFPQLRSPGLSAPTEPQLLARPDVPFFLDETDGPAPHLEIIFRSNEVSLRGLKAKTFEAVLSTEPEATLWALSSQDIAGGNFAAMVIVGDDDILDVNGDLKEIDLKTVLTSLEYDFPVTGQLNSVVQLKGNTESLASFSQTMQLNFKGRSQNVQFGEAPKSKSAERSYSLFSELNFDFIVNGEADGANAGTDKFKLKGELSGKQQKDSFKFSLNGPVVFGHENEVTIEKMGLEGQISSQFTPLDFAGQETAKLKGSFNYLQKKGDFGLNLSSFNVADASGNLKLNLNNLSEGSKQALTCSGKIEIKTSSLRQFLDKLEIKSKEIPPQLLGRAELNSNFIFKQGSVWEINIPNLKGQVDDTKLEAAFNRDGKGNLKILAQADSIDLDAYIPSKPDKNTPPPPAKPWNVKALLGRNLQLSFSSDRVVFMKLNNERVVLNAAIRSGNLEADLISNLYGGTLAAKLNGNEQSSRLNSSFSLKTEKVDLQNLTSSFSGESKAGGLLALNTNLTGQLASWDDVPKAFSGTWGFSVGKGYIVRSSAAGPARPTEKAGSVSRTSGVESSAPMRSNFDYLRGNGAVENGAFKTDNIDLQGPTTSVKGEGEIDLAKEKINLSLDVRLTGVSFPIRLKGNLSDPEITLKSGKFVTKNIWNLGEGLVDLVGGILTLPVKILEIPGNAGHDKNATDAGLESSP